MTTDKRGVSALLVQRQLGLSCYETAWMLLHKLRRAMVNVAREPLYGEVEVDETWVGGGQAGLRGSRQLKGRRAALVLVAVEKRGRGSGRLRMKVIPDFKGKTIISFLKQNISPGSTIYTDGLKSFDGLTNAGFKHIARIQPLRSDLRKGREVGCPARRSRYWKPAAMADRNLPRSEQASTPGLPRRIRLPAQPPQNTCGSLPDPPRTWNWSEINHVRADPRSKGSQPQPIGVC
jgi:transposase-like protein